jgi:AcrR family transcriptional regulator
MEETVTRYRPPRQERSRQSLERLLDAAEAQVREGGFESLTVAEVVRRAGSSVGALYGRFPDKLALLQAVQDRLHERIEPGFLEEIEREPELDESLGQAVERLLGLLARHLLSEPKLFNVFMMQAVFDSVLREGGERLNSRRRDAITAALLVHRAEIGHPEPELAVQVAFSMCMAVMRGRLIYGEAAELQGRFDDEVLVRELTVALAAYLRDGTRAALDAHSPKDGRTAEEDKT